MAQFDYVETATDALGILLEFGGAEPGATFTRKSGGGGQPGQNVPATETSWGTVALIFDYGSPSSGHGARDSSMVLAGDRQLFVAALDASGNPVQAPAFADECLGPDGVAYHVVTVKPIAPNGYAVLYELQLRR